MPELSASDQVARCAELNKELSSLSTAFRTKLLAGTKAGALEFDSVDALAGLSDADIAAAAEAAMARKLDGRWLIALQNTTQQPAQESLTDRATREKLFTASINRSEHGDDNDTRTTVSRIAELRAERAKLFGAKTFADYALEDRDGENARHAQSSS